jgi:enoyl-CoA hydratase/carnithine racemase
MSSRHVKLEVKSGLAVVTLANPDMNRLGQMALEGLSAALPRLSQSDVRAVLIKGEGAAFSYGADVKALFVDSPRSELQRVLERYLAFIAAIEALPKPTIAAVHGVCSSGGLELALAFDYLWAAAGTKIGFKEPAIGIAPLAGGVQRIAARAGSARAMEITSLGQLYDAETFERWNIVNRVVPPDSLHAEAEAFGLKLAAGPTRAFAAIKAMLRSYQTPVSATDAITVRTVMPLMDSKDATTAVATLMKGGGSLNVPLTFTGN